jgi:hypothetical protein
MNSAGMSHHRDAPVYTRAVSSVPKAHTLGNQSQWAHQPMPPFRPKLGQGAWSPPGAERGQSGPSQFSPTARELGCRARLSHCASTSLE